MAVSRKLFNAYYANMDFPATVSTPIAIYDNTVTISIAMNDATSTINYRILASSVGVSTGVITANDQYGKLHTQPAMPREYWLADPSSGVQVTFPFPPENLRAGGTYLHLFPTGRGSEEPTDKVICWVSQICTDGSFTRTVTGIFNEFV